MPQLLVEYNAIPYNAQLIAEAADISKPLVIRNVLLQKADEENHNKRIYPTEILMREIQNYKDRFVTQRSAVGELDHPESPVVNLKNAACNITEIWTDGNDIRGNVEILSTPSGNIVRELVRNNIRIGISSRGMGSVKPLGEGKVEVLPDFSLICFDIVSNPSTKGAFISENTAPAASTPEARIQSRIHEFLAELR